VQIICRTEARCSSFGDVYSQSRCRSDEETVQVYINQKVAEGVVVRKGRQQWAEGRGRGEAERSGRSGVTTVEASKRDEVSATRWKARRRAARRSALVFTLANGKIGVMRRGIEPTRMEKEAIQTVSAEPTSPLTAFTVESL
jgi:hypothetical protein